MVFCIVLNLSLAIKICINVSSGKSGHLRGSEIFPILNGLDFSDKILGNPNSSGQNPHGVEARCTYTERSEPKLKLVY